MLTLYDVLEHGAVAQSALELALPHVMMSVDEARRDNLVVAVNDGGIWADGQVGADLGDAAVFDEYACVGGCDDIVFAVVLEDDAALQKECLCHDDTLIPWYLKVE